MSIVARMAASVLLLAVITLPAMADDNDMSWVDRIRFKGDIRLRYEGIDEDGVPERNRGRFRTRFGLTADVDDDVQLVLQLASGGDDPVSRNQTIGDGFSTKDIGIDLAYVDWSVNDKLHIFGGKMKNPLFRAGSVPLIWDSDLNPEGVAAKYTSGVLFGAAAIFSVEERNTADDSLLYAAQGGFKFDVGIDATVTAGIGYFVYTDTIGNEPFFNGRAKGNSVDAAGNYVFDYEDVEIFAQFDSEIAGWPLRIYAHAAQNMEVDNEDTAYAVGAKIGAAKQQGKSEFSWTYESIEADAVIGTFNDSDFGGGGTDSSGHILKGKYALSKRVTIGGTLFINEVDRFQGSEHDYRRIQLDVEFKFD
jgi:hypothetical protein